MQPEIHLFVGKLLQPLNAWPKTTFSCLPMILWFENLREEARKNNRTLRACYTTIVKFASSPESLNFSKLIFARHVTKSKRELRTSADTLWNVKNQWGIFSKIVSLTSVKHNLTN